MEDDDRPLFTIGNQMFNVHQVVRAQFSPPGDVLKIWFTSDAGLKGKPLVFRGKQGDFVWAYLKTCSDDSKELMLLTK
ncbi:MAG: hypothetical protein QOF62_1216 [Pyrinomonadaceae bacterium]|jgi:hypothetical protein|nr:hypothetical protein [Pyrinomonadaceae bacterium]